MGFKINLLTVFVAVILFSTSCGSNDNANSDFQVSPDNIQNKDVPQMQGSITDLENIFDDLAKQRLAQKIQLMNNQYHVPVCILTVASFKPFDNFTEFSDNVGSQWNYCKNDEGILFVLSSYLGELRVITCTQTETRISDEDFNYMINNIMYESFRNESFEDGLIKAMDFLESLFSKK